MSVNIRKILYATDLSRNAAYAFQYAIYLSKMADTTICILHIVEKMSPDAQIAFRAYLDIDDRRKVLADRAANAIERLKKRLTIFCEKEIEGEKEINAKIASIEVYEGYPAEEILNKAEELKCDAIVMGAHKKGFTHTFLGSVAKSVLRRSRIPTFIVPLPEDDSDLTFHGV